VRRLLGIVALLAGLTWAGLALWARNHPETEVLVQARTAAF
jgi:hypothetical protein